MEFTGDLEPVIISQLSLPHRAVVKIRGWQRDMFVTLGFLEDGLEKIVIIILLLWESALNLRNICSNKPPDMLNLQILTKLF